MAEKQQVPTNVLDAFTSPTEFEHHYQKLRSSYATGRTKDLKWRKWQLKQFWWMIEDNQDRLVEALRLDLRRHPFETISLELRGIRNDIIENIENVEEWSKGEKPKAGFLFGTLGKAHLRKEPLGVVLVIGAWNFPLLTLLSPMLAAIAAGNCVIAKPSELAPKTQNLLMELVPKYLDQSSVAIASGGPKETGVILEHKFDHIMYTGGGAVGRIIAAAAAKHLTPITLELGGQAPAIVCKSANVDLAAKRIAHAKLTNAGQVCLNANHVLVDPSIHDEFVDRLVHWNTQFADASETEMATIINERHWDRITSLLSKTSGKVVYGGKTNREGKFIQPTVVKDVSMDDALMSQELFAPIAPVIKADMETSIRAINSLPHPLGIYIFSSKQDEIDHILNSTTSGGVTINDVMMHAGVPDAPFGGVGESGYGAYHGKWGFDTFSHTRTVVAPPTWLEVVLKFRYMPYQVNKLKAMAVSGKSVGPRGQTMEEQTIGEKTSLTSVLTGAVAVVALLAVMDSASGGKLLFVHTLKDVATKVGLR